LLLPDLLRRRRGPMPARAASIPGQLAAGTRFVGLRIERTLAHGAAGTLYLASDELTGAPLAVKALPLAMPGREDEGLSREAFEREARTAMALRHAGIVTVHGVATLQGLGCIVMELLPGADLTRYTRPGRLLPEALALEIAARISEALGYAHRQGVVHRDVKPANVMFDPVGGSVKLTDFGLARAPDAEATRSGMLLGSPAYMAPELLAGARASAASDLYALGVVLFQLLTGRLPFEADSMGALLRSIATKAPLTVRASCPDLPTAQAGALDAALASVLNRSPADRQSDGDAWASALRQLQRSVF
jgi:eukaryotic-like serine/threonine-protein kinase